MTETFGFYSSSPHSTIRGGKGIVHPYSFRNLLTLLFSHLFVKTTFMLPIRANSCFICSLLDAYKHVIIACKLNINVRVASSYASLDFIVRKNTIIPFLLISLLASLTGFIQYDKFGRSEFHGKTYNFRSGVYNTESEKT